MNHDIVVIGTSAGGLKALTRTLGRLPADFDAAIFVVQHLPPNYPTLLPDILRDTGPLPAALAVDGQAIARGRIHIAPPDHHLLLKPHAMRVVHGPRENGYRPSVDALFRSAARHYGSRVVAVVLSGQLDDGTVGLQAVKRSGGIAVVQDPRDAEYPSMPGSALRYTAVDRVLPLDEIADFLIEAAAMPAREAGAPEMPLDVETDVAEQRMDNRSSLAEVEAIGVPTPFTCPACGGALWRVGDPASERLRCHAGHVFGDLAFASEQTRRVEDALWSAVRLMEEKAAFARRMEERRRLAGLDAAAANYGACAEALEVETSTIRALILNGAATRHLPPAGTSG